MYHKYRSVRVDDEGGDLSHLQDPTENEYLSRAREGQLYGGNAVSFLTPF